MKTYKTDKHNPNDDLPDDDNYDEHDNDSSGEPDYYVCNSCGYTCVKYHGGWGCPKCTAIMEEAYY